MLKPVTIIGGGLAGLTLGIALRQQGVPVTIYEAGNYPRHRVCGEFIHGNGVRSLERLGLLNDLKRVGAVAGERAAFFSGNLSTPSRLLPTPALCISRFILDAWLAEQFQNLGGELKLNTRWSGEFKEGVVRAGGRRPEGIADGWRLFGLKAHATGVELSADLEMHFVPSGYIGLCRLASGAVNVCGLFRSRTPVPDLSTKWKEWLRGPKDSLLVSRLEHAVFDDESFCSIAGISLRPRHAGEYQEICVGDALTMIPPLTGNGMSMAFESAELSLEPLVQYSRSEATWEKARQQIAGRCDHAFARRLRWASLIQRGLFHSLARRVVFTLAARSEKLWRGLVGLTR